MQADLQSACMEYEDLQSGNKVITDFCINCGIHDMLLI